MDKIKKLLSDEHKKKLSDSWIYEKHITDKRNKKIKESLKKRRNILGYVNSPESRKKMSKSAIGRKMLEETKNKISKSLKGRKQSVEQIEKRVSKLRGENSPQWKGGISYEKYTIDWTETLKKSIRERDHYICQICNNQYNEGKEFAIHHIDYDKQNCNPDNLLTLCNSCHSKTNYNREKWIEYFNRHYA